jgi:hypothetical protein
MSTASPERRGLHAQLGSDPDVEGRTVALGRACAEHLQATQPEYFISLDITVDEFAARFAEAGMTVDESVAAGEISAAEGRYLTFCATREDLAVLGHSLEEIEAILEDQRAQACVSSS